MTTRDSGRPLDQPHPARLPASTPGYDLILTAHREAMARGDSGYIDPISGYFVFTAAYLAERACCDCGCRHCPYVTP
jgi:Family of unknown function (DUF5522)